MDTTPGEVFQAAVKEKKRYPFLVDLVIRLVKEKPLGTVGGVIVLLLLLTGIFCDFLAPYGYNEQDMTDRLAPPSAEHPLGCDNLGRDLLSRIIYGARISMFVGFGVTILSTGGSAIIGIISGYVGGWFDLIVQRVVDAWQCIPGLFLILTVMAITGPGMIQVILVLGISGAIGGPRVKRSAVIAIKENVYFEAARAIGVPLRRILIKHILPNVFAIIIISFTIGIGGAILTEASLSFLGFGIPPPFPSWGGMLSGSGRRYMLIAPWMCLWPGLALSLVVYGINMLGDALRDLLDPRLRGGLGRFSGVAKKAAKAKAKATRT